MFAEPKIMCTFVKINYMKKKIIGISGKIGSGKDTFAELLAEQLHGKVERHALADKLRLITEIVSGIRMTTTHKANKPFCNEIRNYTQDQKNIVIKQFGKTIGETLQLVGTDLFRDNYDTDIWVKSFFDEELDDKLNNGKIIVIPDVRFVNEANYILQEGGYLIRLEGDPMGVRENSLRDLKHISETNLDNYTNFSKVIYNNKRDIQLLKKVVNDLIVELSLDEGF
jgi:ABC-type dipeptide/oligopeptide/nickel transport system ATPase subunit